MVPTWKMSRMLVTQSVELNRIPVVPAAKPVSRSKRKRVNMTIWIIRGQVIG